ncbi:MAG: hypothetical protein ACREIV_04685 [Planctomycetaceae bacterium]
MRLLVALLMALLSHVPRVVTAEAPARPYCCPSCGCQMCYPDVSVTKETRHCWEVEHEAICIPPIRFPWSRCRPLECGRVRVVHVLKREEYEVDRCDYQWKVLCEQCGFSAGEEPPSAGEAESSPPPVPPATWHVPRFRARR